MSGVVPPRERSALEGNGAWVESVLEADVGAPHKQRHTAKRIYGRLVEERDFEGCVLSNRTEQQKTTS